ncbi:MAG: hypothetical protein EOP49_17830 [Sphingobacteriales bacterium]|nr:MAG: hypothetical protein EOP49_17830 [Sphingobacteriales bacterium]
MEKCICQNALRTLFILCLSISAFAKGNTRHPATGERQINVKKVGLDFIENKGQWNPEARYKAEIPGGALFLTNQGFVYTYASPEDMAVLSDHDHGDKGHDEQMEDEATVERESQIEFGDC